ADGRLTFSGDTRYRDETPGMGGTRTPLPWTQPEEREREITAQAEETREQITRLTAALDELGRAAEKVRITRKILLELPDPAPHEPSASAPELPGGAAYREIMAVFAEADGPLRARGVCEAMIWTWRRTTSTTSDEAQALDQPRHPDRARARPVHSATTVVR
ncbi:hypothetical protein ACGFX4_37895, partial [Kitasatospora sp. NPDC048365]